MRLVLGFVLCLASAVAQVQVNPLVEFGSEASAPSLSPDGKMLAFEGCEARRCGIYMRSVEGGEPKLFVVENKKSYPKNPQWSPDGQKIAFRTDGLLGEHLFVRDVASGVQHDLGIVCPGQASWTAPSRSITAAVSGKDRARRGCHLVLLSVDDGHQLKTLAPDGEVAAFSPNGRRLAYAEDATLTLLALTSDFRPAGSAETLAIENPYSEISNICWTSDGKQLFYGFRNNTHMLRIDIASGASPAILQTPSRLSIAQALPDGSVLATEYRQASTLWRLDLHSHAKFEKVRDLRGTDSDVRVSPDGQRLAFVSTRTGPAQIWLSNIDGTAERPLFQSIPGLQTDQDNTPGSLEWSPDGKWIGLVVTTMTAGNMITNSWLYVIPSAGGAARKLAEDKTGFYAVGWARDGQSIYAASREITRVSLSGGQQSRITGATGAGIQESGDGRFLYFLGLEPRTLWRASTSGGDSIQLSERTDWVPETAAGRKYLYLIRASNSPHGTHMLIRFDPTTRKAQLLASLPFRPRTLSLSTDERFLFVEQQEDLPPRIVLVRGL